MTYSFNVNWKLPRTEQANRSIREATRERILDAAVIAFARRGSEATMSEVASEAGVSQGLAYRYFKGKEAIYMTLIERMLRTSTPLTSRVGTMPGTPLERLSFIVSMILDDRQKNPELYQFFYQVLADRKLPEDLRDIMERNGKAFQETLRELIVEGQAAGEVAKDDPDELVTAVMICLEGVWREMAIRGQKGNEWHCPKSKSNHQTG